MSKKRSPSFSSESELYPPDKGRPGGAGVMGEASDEEHGQDSLTPSPSGICAPNKELLDMVQSAVIVLESDDHLACANAAFERLSGFSFQELQKKGKWHHCVFDGDRIKVGKWLGRWRDEPRTAPHRCEFRLLDRHGTVSHVSGAVAGMNGTSRVVLTLSDITDEKHARTEIMQQLEIINALYAVAQKFTGNLDMEQLAEDIVETCVNAFNAHLAWLACAESDGRMKELAQYPADTSHEGDELRWDDSPEGQGPSGQALRSGFPFIESVESPAASRGTSSQEAAIPAEGIVTVAAFPLISRRKPFGVLKLYSETSHFFSPERVELLQTYAHQAAAALENARLFAETERRLRYLHALRTVDMAITASLDLRLTFQILLEQLSSQLQVDAGGILLFRPHTQTLEFAAGLGFRSNAISRARLHLGEGWAGRAAMERQLIHIENLALAAESSVRSSMLINEGFVSCYAIPLISKGQLKGVLEIFHRAHLKTDSEWLDFLGALAGQAAVAIDSASLFDDLQRSNAELALAYDTTLEGWARALDLRDKETEGHSRRVMELTVQIAGFMGIEDDALAHVRRGALLHDIGKMGIPDSVLLKPGPLNDEEWKIMRRHPNYSYELLSPIPFLRPALDIPYCHHEKWDGTGYPRGLKGDQIPLGARIFAVVDVWDALNSDRPYRPAWPRQKTLDHIRSLAGTHFDPTVVEAFCDVIGKEEAV